MSWIRLDLELNACLLAACDHQRQGEGSDQGDPMSEAGTVIPESDEPAQPAPRAAKRFNVVVFLIALGTLGILLFWVYRAFARIRRGAD